MMKFCGTLPGSNGSSLVAATALTPGRAPTRSSTDSKKSVRRGMSRYGFMGRVRLKVSSRSGWNPGSTDCS